MTESPSPKKEPTPRTSAFRIQVNAVGRIPVSLLERGVRAVLERESVPEAEISLTLLDDPAIRDLNRRYLDRDRPTDVIAFPLYEGDEPVMGDVYLGLDQARRQAAELEIPLEEELLRLAVHGTLHVLGHDHPEDGDEARESSEMYRIQEDLVERILDASSLTARGAEAPSRADGGRRPRSRTDRGEGGT